MELASRFKRLIAYLLDILIVFCIMLMVYLLLTIPPLSLLLIASIVLFTTLLPILSLIYFATFEQSKYQATPGKMLMKLYVANIDGSSLSLSKALIRSLWFCVPAILASVLQDTSSTLYSVLALVWFVPILFKSRRGMYEILSKTVVLQRQETSQQPVQAVASPSQPSTQ